MNYSDFHYWLINSKKLKSNTANSCISNINRIEKFEGSIANFYLKDQCFKLVQKFSYSKTDYRNDIPLKHNIPIKGNLFSGTSTLKRSLNLYVEFLSKDN